MQLQIKGKNLEISDSIRELRRAEAREARQAACTS